MCANIQIHLRAHPNTFIRFTSSGRASFASPFMIGISYWFRNSFKEPRNPWLIKSIMQWYSVKLFCNGDPVYTQNTKTHRHGQPREQRTQTHTHTKGEPWDRVNGQTVCFLQTWFYLHARGPTIISTYPWTLTSHTNHYNRERERDTQRERERGREREKER